MTDIELKKRIEEILVRWGCMPNYKGTYGDGTSPVVDQLVSLMEQSIDTAVRKERKKVARQLELTVLIYEQEFEKQPQIIESLESRIRAYIRHELMLKK